MAKYTVEVEDFKPLCRKTLRGFISIVIPELRLCIHDIALHQKNQSRWVGLPGRPQIGTRTGMTRRDERNRISYVPVFEFMDTETRSAFSERVIEAVPENFPDAFECREAA